MAVSATISAEDNWTDGFDLGASKKFDVRAYNNSSFVGTVTLQAKRNNEEDSAYADADSFDLASGGTIVKPGEFNGNGWVVRVGVKTGDFAGTSIDVAISQ